MELTTKTTLTTSQAGDIAITAAEGGINYWAVVDEYDWTRWAEEADHYGSREVPEDFVFYAIVDLREGDVDADLGLPVAITPRLIGTGIERFLGMGRSFADPDGYEYMDAEEADVVIQLGAFGKVVFG